MDKENKKIQEPYEPEKTPNPPQRMDPEPDKKPDTPGADQRKPSAGTGDKNDQKREEPHLLSDETQIDDETTI